MTIHSESLALSLASISPAMLALVGGVLAALALLVIVLLLRGAGLRREQAEEASFRAEENEARMAELLKIQAEMQGRIAVMTEVFGARQSELNQTISQRLDGMSQRVSSTITEQTKSTHENLQRLQERLALIDAAQNNIQTLAKDVVGLQAILSNKQTRGAFGQSRMETIVADGLPMGAYTFQQTLSNGSRPDCTIRMPNGAPPLVIDAKFPLEAWNAIRDAGSPEAGKIAGQQFRRDMEVHIRDISEKYLIQGETQDTAFLFVPSESIFAEIHEHFEPVVQKAHRARIVIVSPSLLMLSIQVIQAVLKDQRMRAQAHLIQGEVAILMDDLSRLDERVRKLQGHFAMAQKDIDMVVTSADKLTRRGARIEALEFEAGSGDAPPARDDVAPAKSVESRTGLLKLRVVDEE
ncbi:DNA recombination protein RmuC [Rhizobium ruizarguesonis]|jgi:DNA recombination protein RmuC|uniref:DNA recombination protein RmuC homolog n=1 Tax=Rhizobium ruizarguesonis TaxID=2081791 RepID=A0AAE4YUY7_9HYPH|nr:DNA recombination protein RmuC [Rhizobium ruizarguesonis]MBY5848624.1 DNA recombination protein RmuC [Rhizobium leguminosarum]NKL17445.1 DNA recombination protein RmuC [Rhizobium leguminosarum bv. viciae]QIO45281.1 DNA recombination protein RmuC [Rhizobium leguminosarum bv. trifolii]MBY5883737.1 DNA recombination protein RmuC [Rhizobium leguminosarum]MBY5897437.1 DNA recombination protein RmuC [Rhizobium leguminosarum]